MQGCPPLWAGMRARAKVDTMNSLRGDKVKWQIHCRTPGVAAAKTSHAARAGMLTFITVAVIVAALYFAREVLVPFALAILLSFLLMPAVRLLRRVRAGRVTSVGITVLIAFLAIFAFGAIVTQEISLLGPELPRYQHNIESKLRALPKAIPLQRVAGALHQVTATLKRSEATGTAPTAQSPDSSSARSRPSRCRSRSSSRRRRRCRSPKPSSVRCSSRWRRPGWSLSLWCLSCSSARSCATAC